jgi:hypothetical protein
MRAKIEISLAEAYIYKEFELDGDLHAVFPMAEYLMSKWI